MRLINGVRPIWCVDNDFHCGIFTLLTTRLYLVTLHLFKVNLSVQFVLCKGDSLRFHLGYQFSTRDQDNDQYTNSCAVQRKGAWWYRDCAFSNLNGRYLRGSGDDRVYWNQWKNNYYSLRFTEMKIRPC